MSPIVRPLMLTAIALALSGCMAAPLVQLAAPSLMRPSCAPPVTPASAPGAAPANVSGSVAGSAPGCDTSSLGLIMQGLQQGAQKLAAQLPSGQAASLQK